MKKIAKVGLGLSIASIAVAVGTILLNKDNDIRNSHGDDGIIINDNNRVVFTDCTEEK